MAISPSPARASDPEEVEALRRLVLASLDDDQAVETVSIPLAGKSSIADKVAERIKAELGRSVRIEGLPTADWVLIDAGDVIVHLFRPEVRSFYNLERMWQFGEAPAVAVADRA